MKLNAATSGEKATLGRAALSLSVMSGGSHGHLWQDLRPITDIAVS
jgi:hypothetical protein